jgi:hypothetical protein
MAQMMANVVDFRDPAKFVELFDINGQVMTDEVAYEDLYNVFQYRK